MTKIEFYILEDSQPKAVYKLAVELIRNAYNNNQRVFIHTHTQKEAEKLDELLWTQDPSSFLPHLLANEGAGILPPIQIGFGQEPAVRPDLLVNLSQEVPPFHGQFAKIIEFAHGDEETKQKARERFKYYRERGYPLQHYNRHS